MYPLNQKEAQSMDYEEAKEKIEAEKPENKGSCA